MIRLAIWLAGIAACVYAINRLGYWHDIAAFATLSALSLWTVGAGIWARRGLAQTPRVRRPETLTRDDIHAAVQRMAREREAREGRAR